MVAAGHAPADGDEEDVETGHDGVEDAVGGVLHDPRPPAQHEVDQEAEGQDGEVERRVVVVHVGDARHDHERQVVQEPAQDRVQARVVDLVDVLLRELPDAPLPPQDVPESHHADYAERRRRHPVYEGVSEQEILGDLVVPATHTQAHVQDGPLPPLRGEVVLLVRVRHESVVRRHHSDIQVDEIVEERRLVLARVARGNCVC